MRRYEKRKDRQVRGQKGKGRKGKETENKERVMWSTIPTRGRGVRGKESLYDGKARARHH